MAAPVKYTPAPTPYLGQFSLSDIDTDGDTDVILAAPAGVQAFLQDDAGALVSAGFLPE